MKELHDQLSSINRSIADHQNAIGALNQNKIDAVEKFFGLVSGETVLIDEREGEVLYRRVSVPIASWGTPYLMASKRKKDGAFSLQERIIFDWKVKP